MKHNLFSKLIVLVILGAFSLGTQAYALDFFPSTQSATSSTISNFSGNLYFGMRNNDVTRLQTFLISHNLLGANLNTGFFGLSTFNALRAYQNAVGVPATGFFGPLTRAALNAGRPLNINPAARVVVATSTATSTVIATTTTSTATSTLVSTATSTQGITLNLTSAIATDGSVRVNAVVLPSTQDAYFVTLRAICPTGVSVSQGADVCNSTTTMPVIVSHGTYMSAFTFTNTSGSAQTISFNGQTGPLVAQTSIVVSPTAVVSTSTPPATVLPPVIPSAALIVKGQICTRLGAEWSLTANSISGAVGTCMFRAGTGGQTEALQQLTCQQLRGTYNECLSSCSSSSATATMCNAVCTPGCTNIR